MDHDTAQDWLNRYVAAWKSYDSEEIATLFSEDVAYRYHPYDEPVLGRDEVVASWLGSGGAASASTRDAPGTYDAQYTPFAVDGGSVVAIGTSVYRDHPGGPVTRTYDNCFLIRFDDQARCSEFTELYMQRPT